MSYFKQPMKKPLLTGPDLRNRNKKRNRKRLAVLSAVFFVLIIAYIVYAIQKPEEESFTQVIATTATPLDETIFAGGDEPNAALIVPPEKFDDENSLAKTDNAEIVFERVWNQTVPNFFENHSEEQQTTLLNYRGFLDFIQADIDEVFNLISTDEVFFQTAENTNKQFSLNDQQGQLMLSGMINQNGDCLQFDKQKNGQIERSYNIWVNGAERLYIQVNFKQGVYKDSYRIALDTKGVVLCSNIGEDDETLSVSFDKAPEKYADFIDSDKLLFANDEGLAQLAVINTEAESSNEIAHEENE